jgi:hypothetical protein
VGDTSLMPLTMPCRQVGHVSDDTDKAGCVLLLYSRAVLDPRRKGCQRLAQRSRVGCVEQPSISSEEILKQSSLFVFC